MVMPQREYECHTTVPAGAERGSSWLDAHGGRENGLRGAWYKKMIHEWWKYQCKGDPRRVKMKGLILLLATLGIALVSAQKHKTVGG